MTLSWRTLRRPVIERHDHQVWRRWINGPAEQDQETNKSQRKITFNQTGITNGGTCIGEWRREATRHDIIPFSSISRPFTTVWNKRRNNNKNHKKKCWNKTYLNGISPVTPITTQSFCLIHLFKNDLHITRATEWH